MLRVLRGLGLELELLAELLAVGAGVASVDVELHAAWRPER